MNSLFEIVWIIWLLSEILLNRLFRSKAKDSKELDKNSLRIIWLTIILSVTVGVFGAFYLQNPIVNTSILRTTGMILIVVGIIVRLVAIKTLGKYFTVDLAIKDGHKLIDVGLYRYLRHPSYSGSMLSFFGFGLSLNNWICLFVVFVPVLTSFLYRINLEEKLLLKQLGETYEDYKKKTKRLIPHIY